MYFLGVDIGSLTVKAVLIDAAGSVLGELVARGGYRAKDEAGKLVRELMAAAGITAAEVGGVAATGYGRISFEQAEFQVSEITCQGKGVYRLFPGARTVIDIGGQDSKVIRLGVGGTVLDFAMNDKCAAGTGRFLEVTAGVLEVGVEKLGELSAQAKGKVTISSTCTVFAESEVISHIASGAGRAEIAAGLHAAIASRVLGLANRVGIEPELVLTGGVAKNRGVVAAMRELAGLDIRVPAEPQTTGALGAALWVLDRHRRPGSGESGGALRR